MVDDFVLERTRQADLQPLVANGIPVFRLFGQITADLRSALSEEHAALFAEPNPDPTNGDIQWYTSLGGSRSRLNQTSPDQRAAAELRLAEIIKEISGR